LFVSRGRYVATVADDVQVASIGQYGVNGRKPQGVGAGAFDNKADIRETRCT
jgi:hypothetical protein